MTAPEIVSALACGRSGCKCAQAVRRGRGDVHCPAHADGAPSLSVTEASDGKVLLHCQAGCSQDQVISALRERGLWAGATGHVPQSRPVGSICDYLIKDASGGLVATHRRFDGTEGKRFAWLRPDGQAGLNGTPVASLPLFGSELLAALPQGAPVVVTEGEKAAEALRHSLEGAKVGVLGTVTGAATAPGDEVLGALTGHRVVLWPDNDKPGLAHMGRLAEGLRRIGAAEVKAVEWPDAPPHGDAADYCQSHDRAEAIALLRGAKEANYAQELPEEAEQDQLNALNTQAPTWPAPLDEAAFHGLAGEFVRQVVPYTEADPAALLISFLVEFSSAAGSTAHVMVGATRHPARLSAVVVGQSAKSRKGDSEKPSRAVIRGADPAWGACVKDGLSTGEGIIGAVRDQVVKPDPKTGALVVIDEGVEDKRLLAMAPEFGRVLRVMGRDGNTLSAVIREAWDDGDLRVMTKSPTVATGAHVAVLGHVTTEELRRELQDTDAASGFANRFLWIAAKRSRLLPDPPAFGGEVVLGLSSKVADALSFARRTDSVRRDEDASDLWKALYPDLSRDRPGLAGAILGRHEAQAVRLSLVYALLDQSPTIKVEHLEAAVAVLDYVAASVVYIFGDALGDSVADRIRAELAEHELTRTAIYSDIFSRNVSQARIAVALQLLVNLGLAHAEVRPTGGRPAEVWVAGADPTHKTPYTQKGPQDADLNAFKTFNAYPVEGE